MFKYYDSFIDRSLNRRSKVGTVDFSDDEFREDEKISYCQHCKEYGFQVILQNRIYPDNEPIPLDHDQWKQCLECGLLVPVYEVEKEPEIKDVVETVDNPFDTGKSFLPVDSRKLRKRKQKDKLDYIKDPDLKRELASGQVRLISYTET
jgi:hypothetical protein